MLGLGDRYLVAREIAFDRTTAQYAVFDFETQAWRELPAPSGVDVSSMGGVEPSTVILVGLDCGGICQEDSPGKVTAASIDIAGEAPSWKTQALDFPAQEPKFFSPAFVGALAGAAVVTFRVELFSLTPALDMSRLSFPPTLPVVFCTVGDTVQALVQTPEAQALPAGDPGPLLDPRANHTIAQAKGDASGLSWDLAAGAETAPLAGSNPFFSGVMCGPRGIVVVVGENSYEWDGQQWLGRPIGLLQYGISEAVRTTDGRLVAKSGNELLILSPDGWNRVDASDTAVRSPSLPPALAIAAVGNRVVTFVPAGSPENAGQLREMSA